MLWGARWFSSKLRLALHFFGGAQGGGGVEVGQLYLTLVVLCFSTAVLVP